MPKLMEKKDWMQTVADVGTAESVWFDDISADGEIVSLSVPEVGMYHVILVKVGGDMAVDPPKRKSARDYIGYSRKYRPEWRSTAEVMKELREGEVL